MMKKSLFRIFYFTLCIIVTLDSAAQDKSIRYSDVWVEEISIPNFPALHSGAVAEHNGKWIMMGGRTNGMHGFYPPFAFPANGRQTNVYVVDPEAGSVWSSPIDSLDVRVREQLSSSNMQFAEGNGKMYLSGGYGYHEAIDDFTTFPYLTSADMGCITDSVIAGGDMRPCFKVYEDSLMAVTGARMARIEDDYFLVFGHFFHHRYSVADLGSFIQKYTYQIRKFNIEETADSLSISNVQVITDSSLFRRRDFNMTPFEDNNERGLIVWSGVFRDSVDLPYYNPIKINQDLSYNLVESEQKHAHYTSAAACIQTDGYFQEYFPFSNEAHLFFGGMAEFYLNEQGDVVQDSLVPFVKGFSSMQRYESSYIETSLGIFGNVEQICNESFNPNRYAFDGYEGTNAEFVANPAIRSDTSGVIKIGLSLFEPLLLGYIVGGIESTGPNIANMNDPSLSFASAKVYKVMFERKVCGSIEEYAQNPLKIFPNPSANWVNINTTEPVVRYEILDLTGKVIQQETGTDIRLFTISELVPGTYFLKVFTGGNVFPTSLIKQ